jgi:ribonuclease VapC
MMTLFLDASALVAVLVNEPDARDLAAQIRDDDDPIWSAMSRWEAAVALSRISAMGMDQAVARLSMVADERPFRMVPIGEAESALALDAFQRYGKGRHPARLNMGDCFAYACARTNNARLLYKGDDFSQTDLA